MNVADRKKKMMGDEERGYSQPCCHAVLHTPVQISLHRTQYTKLRLVITGYSQYSSLLSIVEKEQAPKP
jgi:hypothetical protein